MTDSNEDVLRQLYRDVWNGENPDSVDDLVHDAYHIHDREVPDGASGPEIYRFLAEITSEKFSNVAFEIEDVVADGQKVAVRWAMTGMHNGELYGLEATGEEVELSGIEINWFTKGQLIETWTISDQLGLMEQLGALSDSE